MRASLKKAQKKYIEKKKSEGWRNIRFFIPLDIKPKLMEFKNKLMKHYYEKKINN
jgi:hypothetical protein